MQGKWGYRRLTMLVNRRFHQHFNPKRTHRLLCQLKLHAIIRRPRIGCTRLKGRQSYFKVNRLARNFTATQWNEKWVTDVTFLVYGQDRKAYLSAIKYLYNGEIISYVVSRHNDNPLVIQILKQACQAQSRLGHYYIVTAVFNIHQMSIGNKPPRMGLTEVCHEWVNVLIMPQWKVFGVIIKRKLITVRLIAH